MSILRALCAIFLMITLIPAGAGAEPITAETVIDRYIDALGGREALAGSESRHVEGTFEQSGLTGTLDLYNAAPDRYRMTLNLEGMGTFEEGAGDSIGWSMDPMSGPQIMKGKHLASTLFRSRYNIELHYFDLYDTVAYEGEIEFDGIACHKLRLEGPAGTSFEYFDAETGLLRGSEGTHVLAGDQEIRMTSIVDAYAEQDGRLYPRKTTTRSPMGDQTIVITSVTHDSVDPEIFQPPVPVQALLEND